MNLSGSNETRTPRTPRSFNQPRVGRKILSAEPSHLRMSEREMEHMMMMMLHNAVTQVEMEDFDGRGGRNSRPRSRPQQSSRTASKRPSSSRPRRPKSRPRRPKARPTQSTSETLGGTLLPPETRNEVNQRYTVWKLQNFSVTKILREINFGTLDVKNLSF